MSSLLPKLSVRAIAAFRGKESYRLYDRIAKDLFLPRAELDARALKQTREIATHAARTTTEYARRFADAGLNPSKIQSTGDLKKLQPLQKRDLRENLKGFISSEADVRKCKKKSTSGSSGEPLVFYRDPDYAYRGEAATMRNMALSGWAPGDKIGYVWGYEKKVGTALGNLKSVISRSFYFNAFEQTPEAMSRWIATIRANKVQFLYGYPSSLQLFAAHVIREQADVPMRGVFCTAEKYFPGEREEIERAFQCKSYDFYGSSEIQNIAFECPKGSMHIATDFVVVHESETQPASLLLTSFWNRCLPFIRYDLGDYGRLLPGDCACGIHMPLLEILGGSRYDFLATRDGIVHGAILERIFNKIDGVQRYQIVQHALDRYTVRAVPAAGVDRDVMAKALEADGRQVLHRLFGEPLEIRFEYPEEIPVGAHGKYRFVLREC